MRHAMLLMLSVNNFMLSLHITYHHNYKSANLSCGYSGFVFELGPAFSYVKISKDQ